MMLNIGRVCIRVRSLHPLEYGPNPTQLPFLVPDDTNGNTVSCASYMDVEVLASRCPPTSAPVLFESGGIWHLQAEDQGYRLTFIDPPDAAVDGATSGIGGLLDGRPVSAATPADGDPPAYDTIALANADTTVVQVYTRQYERPYLVPPSPLRNPMGYPLDQLLLMNHLATRGGAIVHSASAVVEGRGLVFPGVSGAGKSTLSRLFVAAGLGDALLSDDRTILRQGTSTSEPAFWAMGSPWPGDARIARNAGAPLAALLFLVKAEVNRIVPVLPAEALRRLMPKVSCPWYHAELGNQVLDTCARVVESVPSFTLHFRADGEVVPLLTGLSWLRRP